MLTKPSDVAKKKSEDIKTAKKGGLKGVLKWGPRASNNPVYEAAFSMKNNEISEPIETETGYYIIKVINIRQYPIPPFEVEQAKIKQNIYRLFSKDIEKAYYEYSDELRKKYKLTQKSLANQMTVGIASIKRWEGGIIQSKPMDKVLRNVFWNKERDFNFTGNRELFIPRIKLVLMQFEEKLGIKLLLKGDRFLYAAKYLWYADMTAHRDIGKSMTGATYAALPYGPQLNNYRDLIGTIGQSDISEAEPLSVEENKIIKVMSTIFPKKQRIYDAAHREQIWKSKSIGQIIPYSDSSDLTEL